MNLFLKGNCGLSYCGHLLKKIIMILRYQVEATLLSCCRCLMKVYHRLAFTAYFVKALKYTESINCLQTFSELQTYRLENISKFLTRLKIKKQSESELI